jgi:hypothetical protein
VAEGRMRGFPSLHEAVIAAALVAAFVLYTLPALTPVRNEVAPTIVAAQTAAQRVDPQREQLFVAHAMVVFMDLVAPGMPYTRVLDDRGLPIAARERSWLLAEITTTKEEGLLFRRERGRLWNIARRHYFEIKLVPLDERVRFLSGWSAPEAMAEHQWRRMEKRAVMLLPPRRGVTLLRLHLEVSGERSPTIQIKLNGRVVDELHAQGGSVEREYPLVPARGLPNVLELSTTSRADEPRETGVKLRGVAWGPA